MYRFVAVHVSAVALLLYCLHRSSGRIHYKGSPLCHNFCRQLNCYTKSWYTCMCTLMTYFANQSVTGFNILRRRFKTQNMGCFTTGRWRLATDSYCGEVIMYDVCTCSVIGQQVLLVTLLEMKVESLVNRCIPSLLTRRYVLTSRGSVSLCHGATWLGVWQCTSPSTPLRSLSDKKKHNP